MSRLEVYIRGVLAHVTINLEEWNIAEMGAGDFEDVGAVFA